MPLVIQKSGYAFDFSLIRKSCSLLYIFLYILYKYRIGFKLFQENKYFNEFLG